MNTTRKRYSLLLIAVHWLTALLVAIAYLTSEGGHEVHDNPPLWHFITGLAVLALVLPRLLGRLFGGAPPLADVGGRALVLAAKVGHGLLYLMMVCVPLGGWYTASRMGITVAFAGYTLPPLTAAVTGEPGFIAELHENGGNALVILAGLHAAIALWHHFVRHDDTLRRMRPS